MKVAMRLVFGGILLQFIVVAYVFICGSWLMLISIIPVTAFKLIALYLYPILSIAVQREANIQDGVKAFGFKDGCLLLGILVAPPAGVAKLYMGSVPVGLLLLLLGGIFFLVHVTSMYRRLKRT